MPAVVEVSETQNERLALERFKSQNPDLFRKNDAILFRHLVIVTALLMASTFAAVASSWLIFKVSFGILSAFFWFCLINVTIHHHKTHRNVAASPAAERFLDFLFAALVPRASARKNRYRRAHLNHHRRPFDETDVDHHYGARHFIRQMRTPRTALLYFLELTFVGGHVPGKLDDRYMQHVPLERWNPRDYEEIKRAEVRKARLSAALQWAGFGLLAFGMPILKIGNGFPAVIAWGWAFPILLVKNWAHFLGQFQHYCEEFLQEGRSLNRKTKSFHIPGWINYLAGGEISGHFLHHFYPEMPYYHVETACRRFSANPELKKAFVIY